MYIKARFWIEVEYDERTEEGKDSLGKAYKDFLRKAHIKPDEYPNLRLTGYTGISSRDDRGKLL